MSEKYEQVKSESDEKSSKIAEVRRLSVCKITNLFVAVCFCTCEGDVF
jgi:hypothetical protein